MQVIKTKLRLLSIPGKRKSNENAASSSSSKKRVVFKDFQLAGLRQAYKGTNGHASQEMAEKLAETLDMEAKQVRIIGFTTLCKILSLKKDVYILFIEYFNIDDNKINKK